MKAKFHAFAIRMVPLLVAMAIPCNAEESLEPLSKEVAARYGDLLNDPYAKRFLRNILPLESDVMLRPSEGEIKEMKWMHAQEEQAYPLIVEILQREAGSDGLRRKSQAIYWVAKTGNGSDKGIVLEEVRKQLQAWHGKTLSDSPQHLFLIHCLNFLGRFGSADDIGLIRAFVAPANDISLRAKGELERLQRRLQEESKAAMLAERNSSGSRPGAGKSAPPETKGSTRNERGLMQSTWPWLCALVILGIALTFLKRRKVNATGAGR